MVLKNKDVCYSINTDFNKNTFGTQNVFMLNDRKEQQYNTIRNKKKMSYIRLCSPVCN